MIRCSIHNTFFYLRPLIKENLLVLLATLKDKLTIALIDLPSEESMRKRKEKTVC